MTTKEEGRLKRISELKTLKSKWKLWKVLYPEASRKNLPDEYYTTPTKELIRQILEAEG